MSKIKLQNDASQNQGVVSGPMDGEIDLDESGMLDDSGLLDDSGILNDFTPGYAFTGLSHDAFNIRFIAWWYHTLSSGRIKIADGEYPEGFVVSGDMGIPVENCDEEHYELISVTQGNDYTSGIDTISTSVTLDYIHYPCGKGNTIKAECQPRHCHIILPVVFNIPSDYYLKGIDENGTSNP